MSSPPEAGEGTLREQPLAPRLLPGELPAELAEPPKRAAGRFSAGPGKRFLLLLLLIIVAVGGFALGHWAFPARQAPNLSVQENLLFQRAGASLSAGKLTAAEKTYAALLKLDPLNSYAYYDLGLIYQQASDTDDAQSAYEKALLINPTYQPALFNLATIETPTDPASAITLYEQLQKLPHLVSPDAVAFNLGLLLLQTGQTSKGYGQLAHALALNKSLESHIPSKYLPLPSTSTSTSASTSTTPTS